MLSLAVVAACLAAGAAGATSRSTIPARSTVSAVAADGNDVAFATMPNATDCDRAFVWETSARKPVQLGKKQRCKSKTLGITALGVTKERALWVTATGSSIAMLRIWTATTTRTTPKALGTATRDIQANEPSPIVVGAAGGGLLPYAIGTPGHSWQLTAQGKTPAAKKGMVHVAKVMAATAVQAIADKMLIARAKADLAARTNVQPYVCPVPADAKPPLDMAAA